MNAQFQGHSWLREKVKSPSRKDSQRPLPSQKNREEVTSPVPLERFAFFFFLVFHLLNVESHSTRASSLRIKRPIRNDAPKKGKGTGIQVIDPCIMKAFPSLFYNLHSSSEQTTLRKSAVIQCAVAGF